MKLHPSDYPRRQTQVLHGARSRSKTRIPFSFTDSEAAVLATIEAQDPRLGKVFASLVRHLHSFVKDTRPSQEECIAGVMWLQRVGVMSVDPAVRFEWMLLSDTLGVSMLTSGDGTLEVKATSHWSGEDDTLAEQQTKQNTPGPNTR